MVRCFVTLILALVLYACSTTKRSARIESQTLSSELTDTTRTQQLLVYTEQESTDTTRSQSSVDMQTLIEFIEKGGTVEIDSTGTVRLTGVKAVSSTLKDVSSTDKTTTEQSVSSSAIQSQQNAVNQKEDKKIQSQTTQIEQKQQWYQHPVLFVVLFIAVSAIVVWLRKKYRR